MVRPTLRRVMSGPAHSWPGAIKSRRCSRELNISQLLQDLVVSSTENDNEEDDGEHDAKPERVIDNSESKHDDHSGSSSPHFHHVDWQRKGRRRLRR